MTTRKEAMKLKQLYREAEKAVSDAVFFHCKTFDLEGFGRGCFRMHGEHVLIDVEISRDFKFVKDRPVIQAEAVAKLGVLVSAANLWNEDKITSGEFICITNSALSKKDRWAMRKSDASRKDETQ